MDKPDTYLYFLIMDADLVFLHGHATPKCDATVAKHFIGYHTIQFMDHGAVELLYDERRWTMEGAWCWSAFPGPFIRFHRAQGCPWWSHRYAAVTGPLADRWMAEGLFPAVPQIVADPVRMAGHFTDLYAVMRRTDRWGRLRAINVLERLLLELADARNEGAVSEPWLAIVQQAIADPAQGYDPARLAKRCGMSVVTLRRRFRAATGQSLHACAVHNRLAMARRLLTETTEPIKDIAEQLGYRDVFFFSKQFRRHTGMAPAAFRASASG